MAEMLADADSLDGVTELVRPLRLVAIMSTRFPRNRSHLATPPAAADLPYAMMTDA